VHLAGDPERMDFRVPITPKPEDAAVVIAGCQEVDRDRSAVERALRAKLHAGYQAKASVEINSLFTGPVDALETNNPS
jgi:hypothetical protein